MRQARMFVIDEMSMVGRQMLGKIEFKVRDTLGDKVKRWAQGGVERTAAGPRLVQFHHRRSGQS